jgi:uncharacterized protein YbjT (DUF2867 family)
MKIAVAGGTGTVGRHVVEAGRAGGHDVVVLSRAGGIDLRDAQSEAALGAALSGVDVIVDTTDPHSLVRRSATAFFEEVAGRLQRIGAAQGVGRVVTLSIVGVDRVPGFGYYEAKQRHEAVSLAGPLSATVLRATQFHEFPAQILRATRRGPLAFMMMMRTQPIAARTVGEQLVRVATNESPDGSILQIAGPEPASLVSLARRYLRRRGRKTLVVPFSIPGPPGRALRRGAVLPTDDVPRLGPTFDEWLESPDSFAADR